MKRTLVLGVICLVISLAMAVWFDRSSTGKRSSDPGEPIEAAGADDTHARIELLWTARLGGRLAAVSFSHDGHGPARFGVFRDNGSVEIRRSDSPDAVLAAGAASGLTVDAAWSRNDLFSVEAGRTPALVRWTRDGSTLTRAAIPLAGAPVDLWIDTRREKLWVVLRHDGGGTVRAFSLADDTPFPVAEFDIAAAPVGIFHAERDRFVVVPSYDGRAVQAFDAAAPREARVVELDFRPTVAASVGTRVVVGPSNVPTLAVVEPRGDVRSRRVPAPLTLLANAPAGQLYGFAGSTGSLFRFSLPDAELLARTEVFELVVAMQTFGTSHLLALDAGPHPRVVLLDALHLTEVASVGVEGRPAWMNASGDQVAVVSPAEGVVAAYRIAVE